MIWFVVALVVIAIAAVLLLWVLAEARGIAREAQRALRAAAAVEANTAALWAIPQVNQFLVEGNAAVQAITAKAAAAADAVAGPAEQGGGA